MTALDIYRPFDSGAGSTNLESEWRQMARMWCGQGVDMTYNNGMQVYGDSTGRQVKVKTGRVWLDGFFGENTSEKTMSLNTNVAGNPRIDLIVAQVDPTANTCSIEVVQGTAAASPAIPAMTQSATGTYQVPLGYATVASGYSTVASGDVTEYRQGSLGSDSNGQLRPWRTAWGDIGYAQITSGQTGITAEADVTSLTITFTAIANRRYEVEFEGEMSNDTGGNGFIASLKESTTYLASRGITQIVTGNDRFPMRVAARATPSAGAHTYFVRASRVTAGNASVRATSGTLSVDGAPAYIRVKDVGPAVG